MIPRRRMTGKQAAKLNSLSKQYPKTGRAYRIVSALDDFYTCRTIEEARAAFDSLCSWMRRCRLKPMKEADKTLINHKENILAYFYHRITNAVCEGIHSMIQAAKKESQGLSYL